MPTRIAYEDYEKCVPGCGPGGIACRRSSLPETRRVGPNEETGRWRWMMSNPKNDRAPFDCDGKEYPEPVELEGTRRWYPDVIRRPDGSATFLQWSSGTTRSDVNGMALVVDIEYTREEWELRLVLESDDAIRAMDWRTLVVIYWSLLQWECRLRNGGGITAPKVLTVVPSAVSPQSLKGSRDMASLAWIAGWESILRDRIWRLRPDLRAIRLPDGRVVPGIIDPGDKRIDVGYHGMLCGESVLGDIVMKVATGIVAIATAGQAFLNTMMLAGVEFPKGVAMLRQLALSGSLASTFDDVGAAVGSGVPELVERASGGTATGMPPARPVGRSGQGSGALLAIAVVAALVALA